MNPPHRGQVSRRVRTGCATLFVAALIVLYWLLGTTPPAPLAATTGTVSASIDLVDVPVQLPPSYATDKSRRYPVVYLLHGYGLQAERWMTFARIETGANQSMTGVGTGARAREMILVNPDAYTVYDGSMYSSSVATGDWETFIAEDLVAYIDSRYRTIPNRASRGLAGHSMGGYGTLRLGMKRPDVFSSLYPMSACCMIEGGEPNEALAAAEALKTREAVAALRYPSG
jgi:S-formylglutathione hydrolase FrmB